MTRADGCIRFASNSPATRKRCEEVGRSQRQILLYLASDRRFEFNTAGRRGSTAVLLTAIKERLLTGLLAFFLNLVIFERRVEIFGQVDFDIRVRMLGPDEGGGHGTEQHHGDEDE